MHSPSLQTSRRYSSKRARSPDSTSPAGRPSKRLSVSTDDAILFPTVPRVTNHTSGTTSRLSSEDWVQRTDGLTIDSPSATGLSTLKNIDEGYSQDMYDTMTLDLEEDTQTEQLHKHIKEPTSRMQYPPQNQQSTFLPPSSDSLFPYSVGNSLPHQTSYSPVYSGPPMSHSGSPIPHFHYSSLPPTRPPSPVGSPMSLSPRASWRHAEAPASLSSHRKQRFTMGPRSDCEKCRLGVKGHWMHFD